MRNQYEAGRPYYEIPDQIPVSLPKIEYKSLVEMRIITSLSENSSNFYSLSPTVLQSSPATRYQLVSPLGGRRYSTLTLTPKKLDHRIDS